jgi:hypothetical protein
MQEAVADAGVAIAFTRRGGAARPVVSSLAALVATQVNVRRVMRPHLLGTHPATSPHAPPATPSSNSSGVVPDANDAQQSAGADDSSMDTGHAPLPKLALVFGREESGLTADELEACTHLCSIPTGRKQPSMNLSHAVAVVLAQIYEACTRPEPPVSTSMQQAEQGECASFLLSSDNSFL